MSTFEFEDKARVDRLVGTLHAKGAAAGTVPTAQADGSLRMAAGGAGAIQLASVPVSSAELLALDTTPKVLLPAAGGRLYHIVHGVVLHYRFGTTPYAGGFYPVFGFGTTLEEITVNVAPPSAITALNQVTPSFSAVFGYDATPAFQAGASFNVSGSTGNDGNYTAVSSSFAAGTTTIVTVEPIVNATVDGTITSSPVAGTGAAAYALLQYGDDPIGQAGHDLLAQSADAYAYQVGVLVQFTAAQVGGPWNAWAAGAIENKAWSLAVMDADGTPRPLTLGDGTLSVRVFYTTIDGA